MYPIGVHSIGVYPMGVDHWYVFQGGTSHDEFDLAAHTNPIYITQGKQPR
jgi:hypothetical protein